MVHILITAGHLVRDQGLQELLNEVGFPDQKGLWQWWFQSQTISCWETP